MGMTERKPYTNWTNIIQGPGSARTMAFKKDGMIMVKTIKPERLNILPWEDDGGKITAMNYATFDQNWRKNE